MKLEDQVCSLELSKKLKELGVRQDGYFYWVKPLIPEQTYLNQDKVKEWPEYFLSSHELDKPVHIVDDEIYSYGCGCCSWSMEICEIYSAFTASELSEMIPDGILIQWDESLTRRNDGFVCMLKDKHSETSLQVHEKNEADARAGMIILLIKHGVIGCT